MTTLSSAAQALDDRPEAVPSGVAVEVHDLEKRYGDLEAVRGVSFSVRTGELFGFLGPNGAGKTTTIHMLCTLLEPSDGRATVAGHDVVHASSDVRRSIGLVFQDPTVDEYLTAEQNLRFHAEAYGMPRAEREPRMEELLRLVELWDRRKARVRTFSGGMKRRLEIARGLLHRPKVLFLDEPTLGLDPQTRRRVWEHVHELRRREALTIFLTTHYMDEAEHCDRIAIIDHGRIVALDTPAALKDQVGGDVVTLTTPETEAAQESLRELWKLESKLEGGAITFNVRGGERFLPELVSKLPQRLESVGLRRPTLDDVFLTITGRAIRDEEAGDLDQMRSRRRRMRR